MQNGLYLETFSISNITFKQFYLKWNQKIDLSINEIIIDTSKSTNQNSLDIQYLNRYSSSLSSATHWFDSFVINHIQADDFNASFIYKDSQRGVILAHSKDLTLNASLKAGSNSFFLTINRLENRSKKISIAGEAFFEFSSQKLFAQLDIDINSDLNATLYATASATQLKYSLESHNKIRDLEHLINLASLPKEVRYWAFDAIDMSHIDLRKLDGFIDYDAMEDAVKNISILANVHKLNYSYNPKLDAIHTEYTELEFSQGILYIRPKKAYSYGTYLNKSWLKIDFLQEEELLTLSLIFDGVLNKDILHILNTYKIKLPLEQNSGTTSTNLKLKVNLRTIDIDARGDFFVKKANFTILDLGIDVFDAHLRVDNFDVAIKKMRATYKDIAEADVTMHYNAKRAKGEIEFNADKIELHGLKLNQAQDPLHITYRIDQKKDTIEAKNSSWMFQGKRVLVDALTLPFSLKTLQVQIPTTYIEVADIGSAFASGVVDIKSMKANIFADILKLSYDGVELSQSNTPLKIIYDKELSVTSQDAIHFSVAGTKYRIEDADITLNNEYIVMKNTSLDIGKFIETQIYTKYNFASKKAHVSLSNFTLKESETGATLYKKAKIMLSINHDKEQLHIDSSELDSHFSLNEDGWRLYVNSLGRVANDFDLLKKFSIDRGDFTLYKKNSETQTRFKAKIEYPYQILNRDTKPTSLYNLTGKINKDAIYCKINKQISLRVDKDIKINIKKAEINILELVRLIQDTAQEKSETAPKNMTITMQDSSLHLSKSRKILSDTIRVQYSNNILTAQLKYAKGKAGLRYEKKKFHIYGENFNDTFMENLFSLAKFSGGEFDFSIVGELDAFRGVFHIKETTITDYVILNNILAFINTVPSLVTFSLPGYNKNGLFVDKAYVNFTTEEDIFHLNDIYLGSKELNILGKGLLNTKEDSIDITLNLKTDLGSNLSKIPLVGYIIFDKDSISTTLKVSDKLSNPKVQSLFARDIAVAPLNIIKRTLTLPLKLFDFTTQEDNSSKE